MKPIGATGRDVPGRGHASAVRHGTPADEASPGPYAPDPESAIPWPGRPDGVAAGPAPGPVAATGRYRRNRRREETPWRR